MHFCVEPDPNQFEYLDPFPDIDRNPGSHWFCIKDSRRSSTYALVTDVVILSHYCHLDSSG